MKAGPVTATALREALGALDADAVARLVAKREDARREAILAGDAKGVSAAEAALTKARLEAERVKIARDELTARLTEAERREADEAVAARITDLAKRRNGVRKSIERDLAPALRTVCTVLGEIAEIDDEITAENTRLDQSGRRERIALTEDGTTPVPAGQLAEIWRLTRTLTIRPISPWGVVGWNWPEWNRDR